MLHISTHLQKSENHQGETCLSNCNSKTFILLLEKRGHEDIGHRTNSETKGGPRHHQTGDGHIGAKGWIEEAETQAQHGDARESVADDVDMLAVQFGL